MSPKSPMTLVSPALVALRDTAPSPARRALLLAALALVGTAIAWMLLARLDIVIAAAGKLVPTSDLKIVQPAEAGVVDELRVQEGQRVREGQLLLRLNATLSDADQRSLASDVARRRLDLRRIDAELAGQPLVRRPGDEAPLFDAVAAQQRANQTALHDALAQEQAAMARASAELAGAIEQRDKLARVMPLVKEQAAAFERLHREGYAGRLMHLEREREAIEKERDLAAAERTIDAQRAAIAMSRQRLAQLHSAAAQRLQSERVEARTQLARLEQELAKAAHRGTQLELRAPHDGVVKELAVRTRGSVVQPGAVLLTLVPDHEPLLAEVWLRNSDIGFVEAGMPVQLKLAAFPFQKYGLLAGRVQRISADATEPTPGQPLPGAEAGPVFKAIVALDSQQLDARGERHRLSPGMAVAAEIHQGTRSVLEYLLSPIQRVGQEAARER